VGKAVKPERSCPFALPAHAVCLPCFSGVRHLCQSSEHISQVSKLGPRADREGSLVCEPHRQGSCFRCLFKNGCGVLRAVVP
jgi:hypothetical protein